MILSQQPWQIYHKMFERHYLILTLIQFFRKHKTSGVFNAKILMELVDGALYLGKINKCYYYPFTGFGSCLAVNVARPHILKALFEVLFFATELLYHCYYTTTFNRIVDFQIQVGKSQSRATVGLNKWNNADSKFGLLDIIK